MSNNPVQTKFDRPIIFRTCSKTVYKSTLSTGEIWLRSSRYYREIEDKARQDQSEGINSTQALFPLCFEPKSAQHMTMQGSGSIGQAIIPHYIMSLHGASITENIRKGFGGYTFGIHCIADLAAEIVYKASQKIGINAYRFGQVAYHRTALTQSLTGGGSAVELTGTPSVYIKSINTDVLRKDPVEPFISQDEWRIAVFPIKRIGNNFREPLKLHVDPKHFFGYIDP